MIERTGGTPAIDKVVENRCPRNVCYDNAGLRACQGRRRDRNGSLPLSRARVNVVLRRGQTHADT